MKLIPVEKLDQEMELKYNKQENIFKLCYGR